MQGVGIGMGTGIGVGMVDHLTKTDVLFEAFRNTSYNAETPDGPICIRIDEHNLRLDRLLEKEGFESWAYITAYNPNGAQAAEPDNEAAQRRLEAEFRAGGFTFYAGASTADAGDWPAEPSFLVLGIAEEHAIETGSRYDQAAIVAGVRHQKARLMRTD